MGTALDGTYTPLGDVLNQWGSEDIPVGQGGYVDTGGFSEAPNTGGGINAQGIAKALQGLGGQQGAQKPAVANLPGASGVAPLRDTASSGAYQGNATGMNQLVAGADAARRGVAGRVQPSRRAAGQHG